NRCSTRTASILSCGPDRTSYSSSQSKPFQSLKAKITAKPVGGTSTVGSTRTPYGSPNAVRSCCFVRATGGRLGSRVGSLSRAKPTPTRNPLKANRTCGNSSKRRLRKAKPACSTRGRRMLPTRKRMVERNAELSEANTQHERRELSQEPNVIKCY